MSSCWIGRFRLHWLLAHLPPPTRLSGLRGGEQLLDYSLAHAAGFADTQSFCVPITAES
ncbi:MAG: hypothetical protein JWO13_3296 [Acidobacteriales bacterium]|nr:hypothetical protein [Terriglobales bacterium]